MFNLFIFILMMLHVTTMFKQLRLISLSKHVNYNALLIAIQPMKWLISIFSEMTLTQIAMSEVVMGWLCILHLI